MPKTRHYIVYVPGLGDSRILGQSLAVRAWRLQGVSSEAFRMNWADSEAFEPKLERLVARIDSLTEQGYAVSLIAASAGASAALHAYGARPGKLHGMVAICGKLQGIHSVHPTTYGRNPSFQQSMQLLEQTHGQLNREARQRILSMHALADEAVPLNDTKMQNVQSATMPVAGHFFGIAFGLTLGSWRALRFLKRLPPR